METYQGLVLAQRNAGDRGKFIDVLTEHNTLQEIYIRGGKKLTSSSLSATQMFSYARLCVRTRGDACYLDSAEPIRIFYRLRQSLPRFSLAAYFCDLIRCTLTPVLSPGDQCQAARLALNTLHHLEKGTCSNALLKPVFELRLMTELGMMPNVLICQQCGAGLPQRLYFDIADGCYYCKDCLIPEPGQQLALVQGSVLTAMRHIIYADFDRLFHFRLGPENLAALGACVERFTLYHLELMPKSLQFYHQVCAGPHTML